MPNDFTQLKWDSHLDDDCRQLVRLAIREDLDCHYDWTTLALVPEGARGEALVVPREAGVICGHRAAQVALDEAQADVAYEPLTAEGATVEPGTPVAHLSGSARDMLTLERLVLNLLGRLSGVATLTSRFVAETAGTKAAIYDTRKTTPGWRRLEKFAVGQGGGRNHRTGLFDAVMIKDNHLAFGGAGQGGQETFTPAQAVQRAREFLAEALSADQARRMVVEIEVDSLEQLREVLPVGPDVVLLDNMPPETLRHAVALRDERAPGVVLEASGGVRLETVAAIAATGVERISAGALTHSAIVFDAGLDWQS